MIYISNNGQKVQISDESGQTLIRSLGETIRRSLHTGVTELIITRCDFQDQTYNICNLIKHFVNLRSLSISARYIKNAAQLAEIVNNAPYLSNVELSISNVQNYLEILNNVRATYNIVSLGLGNAEAQPAELSELYSKVAEKFPGLLRLSTDQKNLDNADLQNVSTAISKLRLLKELTIDQSLILGFLPQFTSMLGSLEKLNNLSITQNSSVETELQIKSQSHDVIFKQLYFAVVNHPYLQFADILAMFNYCSSYMVFDLKTLVMLDTTKSNNHGEHIKSAISTLLRNIANLSDFPSIELLSSDELLYYNQLMRYTLNMPTNYTNLSDQQVNSLSNNTTLRDVSESLSKFYNKYALYDQKDLTCALAMTELHGIEPIGSDSSNSNSSEFCGDQNDFLSH